MDKQRILDQLEEKYPDKATICLPGNQPTEILCEVKPTSEHPKYSLAIAVIDSSVPHYHKETTETYKVIRGKLSVTVDDETYELNEGDTLVIKPGSVHSAVGNETWVECKSKPGWTSDDHILVNRK